MNNKQQNSKFDGVFTLLNDNTLYRIAEITSENKDALKKLVPTATTIIDNAVVGTYLLEDVHTSGNYRIISETEFEAFTKMDNESTSRILNGGLC